MPRRASTTHVIAEAVSVPRATGKRCYSIPPPSEDTVRSIRRLLRECREDFLTVVVFARIAGKSFYRKWIRDYEP